MNTYVALYQAARAQHARVTILKRQDLSATQFCTATILQYVAYRSRAQNFAGRQLFVLLSSQVEGQVSLSGRHSNQDCCFASSVTVRGTLWCALCGNGVNLSLVVVLPAATQNGVKIHTSFMYMYRKGGFEECCTLYLWQKMRIKWKPYWSGIMPQVMHKHSTCLYLCSCSPTLDEHSTIRSHK